MEPAIKLARSYLYGSKKVPQDFQEALRLFRLEAEQGNALFQNQKKKQMLPVSINLMKKLKADIVGVWFIMQ